jgi:hypothetical protein
LPEKCVQCVSNFFDELPAELDFLIDVWPDLDEEIKEKIMEMAMNGVKKRT